MGGPLDWIRSVWNRKQARIDKAINPAAGTTGEPLGMDLYSYYGMDAIGDYLRVDQDLVARYLDYNEMISYPEIAAAVDVYAEDACITDDTEIPFLDGTVRKVGDLFRAGVRDGWVYGYDLKKGHFTATCFERVEMVNPDIEVIEVVYKKRTGETGSIKVTAEHKFLLRDGTYCKAADLKPGDRLMPLYRCYGRLNAGTKGSYERVMIDPRSSSKKWMPTHQMVLREKAGAAWTTGLNAHHEDENPRNNHPDNIVPNTAGQHAHEHHARRRNYSDAEMLESVVQALRAGETGINGVANLVGRSVSELWHWVRRCGYEGWNDFRASTGAAPDELNSYKLGSDEERLEKALEAYSDNPVKSLRFAAEAIGYTRAGFYAFLGRLDLTPETFREMGVASITANHAVVEIRPAGREAVYDLVNSRQTGNFAAGRDGQYVVVKNTQPNTMTGDTVWIESDDDEVRTDLSAMLKKRVDIENEIWGIAKTLVMYGNDYSEILVAKEEGVVGLHALPPETMRRVEGMKGELLGFVQDPTGQFQVKPAEFVEIIQKKKPVPGGVAIFEPWQIVHDRLQNQYRQSPYGTAVLEPARWIWKRLLLLEDAMMIYRLTRAPSRFAFYVDVGEMPPRQAMRYMQTMRQNFRKKKFVNPQTGKLDLRFSPLCFTGDTKVALLDGTTPTFEELAARPPDGKPVWVYSYDATKGEFVPGKARNPRKTGTKEVCKVHLDNGSVVRCTPDHRWMLRDGTYREAKDLTPGTSLMPCNRYDGSKGYELLYHPGTKKTEATHKMVARNAYPEEYARIPKKASAVHHGGLCTTPNHDSCPGRYCKRNNSPEALEVLTSEEHEALHQKLLDEGLGRWRREQPEKWHAECLKNGQRLIDLRNSDPGLDARLREASRNNLTAYNQSATHRQLVIEQNRRDGRAAIARQAVDKEKQRKAAAKACAVTGKEIWDNPEFRARKSKQVSGMQHRWWTAYREWKQTNLEGNPRIFRSLFGAAGGRFNAAAVPNHKVVRVEFTGEVVDVYDLTVEKYENFVLADAGVVVHNSQDEDFYIPVRGGRESTRIDVLQGPDFPGCVSGDTVLHLLDGRDVPIKELTDSHKPGMTYPILSIGPDGKLEPDVAYDPRLTRKNAEVYEVLIDDGGKQSKVICTGNHPFRLRFGRDAYQRADQLKPGDRLMPFNRRMSEPSWSELTGYHVIYDPGNFRDDYVHKIVGRSKFGFRTVPHGHVIHHNGPCVMSRHGGCCHKFCKLNNSPEALLLPTVDEHGRIHAEFGSKVMRANWKKWRKDPAFVAELRRKMLVGWKAAGSGAKVSRFWQKKWSEPGYKASRSGKNHGNSRNDLSFELFVRTVQDQKLATARQLWKALGCCQGTYERILQERGYTGRQFFLEFCARPSWGRRIGFKVANHKVISVRKLPERMDVYDISVRKNHNFAVNNSVFVHNSTEDTLYFYQKLLTALKVPPAFLGREENTSAKNVLAHEDVRFARAVMRVQRELRNGLKKTCNVHLASRNIDPESVDYEVFMTTPSGIYELAQMEIRKARVEFAELLQDGEWVSKRWIMREILGFSDDQVDTMMKERLQEAESEAPPNRGPAPRPFGPPPTNEELQPGERFKRVDGGRRVIVDDLDAGSKKAEAMAKKHLDEMLKHNKGLDKRLAFLSGLCQDIRMNMPRNGKH